MLTHIFAINVTAYAVMSNNYHVVLRMDQDPAQAWSTEQVLQRWTQLFTGPLRVRHYLSAARACMPRRRWRWRWRWLKPTAAFV